ncbi:alpha/beta-Hydrolases superfamily protein [Perilla frutescens var. hirtella]|nr:alpha/beta-Hydrolases superfamily protein [Perilla frutescens var. hirtella]
MAASARILHSSYRRPPNLLLHFHPPQSRQHLPSPHRFSPLSLLSHNHHSSKSLNSPSFNPFPVFGPSHFPISSTYFDRLFLGPNDSPFIWNFAPGPRLTDQRNSIGVQHEDSEVAVVMLGWLGAKPKHLKRYIELYNAKGIHAVTFVASVMDVLSFDLGKKLEERVRKLADELAAWLSDESGRDRFLIFHTFSNTGWLAFGAILDNLKDRQDLLEKIKGCVVDSGGDPDIDPKVWAAGFSTALLKKSSSATYPSPETARGTQSGSGKNGSRMEEKGPFFIETLVLAAFEKLFSYLLNLPDVNQRLRRIISVLSKSQPPCPQLYLYSTGDKVIPFRRVESFLEEQGRTGKQVFSYNFGSSPHVDHYRTFPDLYASQVDNFLKECLSMIGKL